MIVCCISASVNVIGNCIFIPFWGGKAAAGTTVVCSLVIMVMLFFKVDKNIKIDNVIRVILTPLVGCIGIMIVCLFCKEIENLWVRIITNLFASIGVYSIIQVLLKNELVSEVLLMVKNRLK